MELGIYHEFPVLPGRSQAECFAAGFDIVDVSEEYGLDVMWLAELHFDIRRALAASPLVLGTAIAARTERIRIGTSVQVLPLANPLRIAEEAATLDHVSKGRLIFGVGRSGVVKTYEALNIAYSESKEREIECLEIIQRVAGRQFLLQGQVLRHSRRYGGAAAGATTDARNPHRCGERRNIPRGRQSRPRPVPVGSARGCADVQATHRRLPQSLDRLRTSRGGTRLSPLPRLRRQNRCGGPGSLRADADAAFSEPKPPARRLLSSAKQPAGPSALENLSAPH